MKITGDMLIGKKAVRGQGQSLQAFCPTTGEYLAPDFYSATVTDVENACDLAQKAFDHFRTAPLTQRAELLEHIAQGLLDLGDVLIERAHQESALPVARLKGECQRTVNQLKLFAQVIRDGHWLHATIDHALPERTPPRSDLRLQSVALGPVAVFGASNFPLAFSVAGGDTASALAAGCPVIVKVHPAHLGTSELVGRVIQKAVADSGLPEGVFSLLVDADIEIGQALVAHPVIQAVGFTGSRRAGLALIDIANKRPQPIPVYAEMSAVNPVFMLPNVLNAKAPALAGAFVQSFTMGVGQFCTNPGIVLGIDSPAWQSFIQESTRLTCDSAANTMLTQGIAKAFEQGIQQLTVAEGVSVLAQGNAAQQCQAQATLLHAKASDFLHNGVLEEEVFGPSSLLITCTSEEEMLCVAEKVDGQLTATLHLDEADKFTAQRLLPILERKAGRILINGWPTGVEVCHAMVHGGPFPSTSSVLHTSVGTRAIERFLRPVCYQDLPAWLLPQALQDNNPLDIWRLHNGELKRS